MCRWSRQPAWVRLDRVDADQRYQEEEEWLRAQDAAWSAFGLGCVVVGVAAIVVLVAVAVGLIWTSTFPALK